MSIISYLIYLKAVTREELRAGLEEYVANAFTRKDLDQDVLDFMSYMGTMTCEGLLTEDEMDEKAEEYQGWPTRPFRPI